MKTLGLIGGTSWHSTIEYYRLINQMASKSIGEQANPPLIIHSINIELMRKQNRDDINAKYLEVSRKLEAAGASAIIICANTPHMVFDFVQPKINIPILHIADATGQEAKKLRLNKLGLLGNRPTMTGHFIKGRLEKEFVIKTIIPADEHIDKAHDFVSKELTQGIFSKEAKQFFSDRIDELKWQGAEGIILGCTELPLLLNQSDIVLPSLATTELHAQMAVDFILE